MALVTWSPSAHPVLNAVCSLTKTFYSGWSAGHTGRLSFRFFISWSHRTVKASLGAGERSSREVDLLMMQPASEDAVSEY